ncbi:MAG: phenylalanine--tRNA ligase subunit alpha [Balneolales bacterium]|nr:phenylalanine--tRNA ligase subunit alpha [Balneolales bacterium]
MSQLTDRIKEEIHEAVLNSKDELESFRLKYISRKGRITELLSKIGSVAPHERKEFGQKVNHLKELAHKKFSEAKEKLEKNNEGNNSGIRALDDPTLMPAPPAFGRLHPLSQTQQMIKDVFFRLGFTISDGPELEDDFHNFTALNFPPEHPARDMQDTFFIKKTDNDDEDDLVLRTHTSPVQIRLMQSSKPPFRSIMPGRVYRNESITAKSYCLFHQVEGLYVDKDVSLAELIDTLVMFVEMIYGEGVRYQIRPSFFPFTEPSLEMDIWWGDEKNGKWLEILGAGMVHPNVLKACGVDPEIYSGFAFGMGVERIAMLLYGIDDIRHLYDNDLRFLQQF